MSDVLDKVPELQDVSVDEMQMFGTVKGTPAIGQYASADAASWVDKVASTPGQGNSGPGQGFGVV